MNRRKRQQNERRKRHEQRESEQVIAAVRAMEATAQQLPTWFEGLAEGMTAMVRKVQEWAIALAKLEEPGRMLYQRALTGDLLSAAEAQRLALWQEAWDRMRAGAS